MIIYFCGDRGFRFKYLPTSSILMSHDHLLGHMANPMGLNDIFAAIFTSSIADPVKT